MNEAVWSMATPRGVRLDAVSFGGTPDLTPEDLAIAAAGLPRITFAAALYSLAGDDSQWACLRTYLLEWLLAERERQHWAQRVENVRGQRVKFGESLVTLVLAEERSPGITQAAPTLRAHLLNVEPEIWRKHVSHQWAAVSGEFARHLLTAQEHVRRKMR
jgi:hypothetical protein